MHRGPAHLQAAEFLYENQLFPERVYTFKHALTHAEWPMGGAARSAQRLLHWRIVAAIETAPIADRARATRGTRWRTMPCGARCGTSARRPSHARRGRQGAGTLGQSGGGGCFEQALVALEHLPEAESATSRLLDVRFGLASCLVQRSGMAASSRICARRRGSPGPGRPAPVRLGCCYMTDCLGATSDPQRAVEVGQRALAPGRAPGDAALQVVTHLFRAGCNHGLGDYPQAMDLLRQNVVTSTGRCSGALRPAGAALGDVP